MAILLLIAGTYTPYCYTVLRGWIGWTLLGIVWGCAAIGIVLKAFFTGRHETVSVILYIVVGWACILAIKPLYTTMPFNAFIFLVTGGASLHPRHASSTCATPNLTTIPSGTSSCSEVLFSISSRSLISPFKTHHCSHPRNLSA